MNYILFDDASRMDLLPLTFLRPVADIRLGILTIREKWEKMLGEETSTLTERYLATKYPLKKDKNNILINGSVCPTKDMVKQVKALKPDECLVSAEYIIALHVAEKDLEQLVGNEGMTEEEIEKAELDKMKEIVCTAPHIKLDHPWDVFVHNGQAIEEDFSLLTARRKSAKLSETNRVLKPERVFVEEGVKAEFVNINASTGPVYIGKNAEIMEGALLRGPLAIGENAVVKMGAKLYGNTTIGPGCKVGGEVNNVVFFGNSNKAHDGFIGNSVIAEWCNLGADTNNSNLKNTYDEVRIWSYNQERFIPTGKQFCGLIMGDHSKCGINTMFNTGTVVGIFANIFGHGYQRNFIPSFSWGSSLTGYTTYDIKKALQVAEYVYKRRDHELEPVDREILETVHKLTFTYRKKRV